MKTTSPKPKNPCGKRRQLHEPYEVWKGLDRFEGWEWRVLKKYQPPDAEADNEYAVWLCAVKSPCTHGQWETGDVYVREVKYRGEKVS